MPCDGSAAGGEGGGERGLRGGGEAIVRVGDIHRMMQTSTITTILTISEEMKCVIAISKGAIGIKVN